MFLPPDTTPADVPARPGARTRRSAPQVKRQRLSTVAAYARDLHKFIHTYGGSIPCSADDLIKFILLLHNRVATVTIARRCMAIQDAHLRAGHPTPTDDPRIREALRWMVAGQSPVNLLPTAKGAKAGAKPPTHGQRVSRQAKPINRALLARIFDAMGSGMRSKDRRDKAIMLLGFSGLKRGVICRLNIEDCSWTNDVLLLRICDARDNRDTGDNGDSAGHTDDHQVAPVTGDTRDNDRATVRQEIRTLAIPFTRGELCAASACKQWLEHLDLVGKTGPMFCRFDRGSDPVFGERLDSAWVSAIVKTRLKDAGIDEVADYSAESLRRGHLSEVIKRPRK